MSIKRLAKLIEEHYLYHTVHIKLKLQSVVGDGEGFIFRIILKPGTKVNLT